MLITWTPMQAQSSAEASLTIIATVPDWVLLPFGPPELEVPEFDEPEDPLPPQAASAAAMAHRTADLTK
jgi:hypothetical protein